MCAIGSWGAHESFMHPIFVLKNGCDILLNFTFVYVKKYEYYEMKKLILIPEFINFDCTARLKAFNYHNINFVPLGSKLYT
jgi:hypothetical protein